MIRTTFLILLCTLFQAGVRAEAPGSPEAAAINRVNRLTQQNDALWPAGRSAAPETDPQSAGKVAIEASKAEDAATRRRGMEGLVLTAPDQNVDAILRGLGDTDSSTRAVAQAGLAKCDKKVVLDRVLTVVCGGAPELEKGMNTALPGLKALLEEPLIGVLEAPAEIDERKKGAGFCLGRMKSSVAIPLLSDAAFASDATSATVYVNALLAIQDPLIVPRLEDLAAHPAPEIRRQAVQGLADLGGPDALAALGRIAAKPPGGDDSISRKAATLLGNSGKPEVVPMLAFALERNPSVEHSAIAALRKITQDDYGDEAKEWLNWYNRQVGRPPVPETDDEGTDPKILGADDTSDQQMANDATGKKATKKSDAPESAGKGGAKQGADKKKRGGVRGFIDKFKPKPKPSAIPKPEKVHVEGMMM